MEEQWVCQNPDRCRKMASRYGEKSHIAETKLKQAIPKYRLDLINVEKGNSHLNRVQVGRGISKREILRVLHALVNEDDLDIFSEVIDYHRENDHDSMTVHGVIGKKHIHVVVSVNESEEKILIYTVYDPADEPEIWDQTFSKRICFCPKKERRAFYRSHGRDVY